MKKRYDPFNSCMRNWDGINKKMVNLFNDIDHDGVSNFKDCRPFDKRYQHIKPNKLIEQDLRSQPIFFASGKSSDPWSIRKQYHYSTPNKRLPESVLVAKQRFQSAVHKRPDILGNIKRSKPVAVIVTSRGGDDIKGHTFPTTRDERTGRRHIMLVRTTGEKGYRYSKADIHQTANVVAHESEHIRQYNTSEDTSVAERKYFKGRYEEQKGEQMAIKKHIESENKWRRMGYGAKKYFQKKFGEMTE